VRLSLHDLLLFTVAGGLFCYFISSYLTKPLYKLGEAAANIADGRLDTRVDPSLTNRRDEIADLARNFDRMAERIESLITGQRRLLGDVSHELRSPLSRLMVALSLVKQGSATEAAENLERIGLEARRLDTLIGQLLTLTRIDSGVDRGSSARFDLTSFCQEVANDGDFEARSRKSPRGDPASGCLHRRGISKMFFEALSKMSCVTRSATPRKGPPSKFLFKSAFREPVFGCAITDQVCRKPCCPKCSFPSGASRMKSPMAPVSASPWPNAR